VGALFGKICGAYAQDQDERPNDRVLFNFCHTISLPIFVYGSAYFRLLCFDMFSLFLIISNFDLIKFWYTCGAPKVWCYCSAEHVRTLLNPALFLSHRGAGDFHPLISFALLFLQGGPKKVSNLQMIKNRIKSR